MLVPIYRTYLEPWPATVSGPSLDDYYVWLDPGFEDVASLCDLLRPYDAGEMRRYPVSTRVNEVANDDAQCGD